MELSVTAELRELKSTETDIDTWHAKAVALLSGGVILWGKVHPGPHEFLLYTPDGDHSETYETPCHTYSHVTLNLLPVVIGGTEYLAIACWDCRKISLINLLEASVDDDVAFEAFDSGHKRISAMCHGGTSASVFAKIRNEIVELDCETTEFKVKRTLHDVTDNISGMCYVPSCDVIVMLTRKGDVLALSNSEKSEVWSIHNICGKFSPPITTVSKAVGLVYLPDQHTLLVGDVNNKRILAVAATSGVLVQTIKVDVDMIDLLLYEDRLIVVSRSNKEKVVFNRYKVSSRVTFNDGALHPALVYSEKSTIVSCIMSTGELVVLSNETSDPMGLAKPPTLRVFPAKEGPEPESTGSPPAWWPLYPVCRDHVCTGLAPFSLDGRESLAACCSKCGRVGIYDVKKPEQKPVIAYRCRRGELQQMSPGPPGEILLLNVGRSVVAVDISTGKCARRFTLPLDGSDERSHYDTDSFCYNSQADVIVVIGHVTRDVEAYQKPHAEKMRFHVISREGDPLWTIEQPWWSEGRITAVPMVSIPDSKLILVADNTLNNKILVLSGGIVQTITIESGITIKQLCAASDRLIIGYRFKFDSRIRFVQYKMSFPWQKDIDRAYQAACAQGSATDYRVKVNLIGHQGAGKTSLATRLMGQAFQDGIQSTEGIAMHRIKVDMETLNWLETPRDIDEIFREFTEHVLPGPRSNTKVKMSDMNEEESDEAEDDDSVEDSLSLENNPDADQNPNDTPPEEEYDVGSEGSSEDVKDEQKYQDEPISNLEGHQAADDDSEKDKRKKSDDIEVDLWEETDSASSTYGALESFDLHWSYYFDVNAEKLDKNISKKTLKQLLAAKRSETVGKTCTVSLWDNGGQDEFYVTHHLFLDVEAINLIVMDISIAFHEPLNEHSGTKATMGIPSTPCEFLHYWLNTIYSKASESVVSVTVPQQTEPAGEPQVALVLTHKDLIQPVSAADEYVEKYIEGLLKSLAQKPYSCYVTRENIYVIDNKYGPESDFIALRNQLFMMMSKQKAWGMQIPVRWLKMEADILEHAKKELLRHVQRSTVATFGKEYKMNEAEVDWFLAFYHRMGEFVYFSEPKELQDVVIIDPQWLVDIFKTLITAQEFLDNTSRKPEIVAELRHGVVSEKSLEVLWEGNDVQFLTELMMKYNLLMPIAKGPTRQYLIPSMLPQQAKDLYSTEPFKSMELVFNCSYKPESGVTILIGTFHKLLSLCSKVPSWRLCIEDHLSYTDASFELLPGLRLAITSMKNKTIRSSIWCLRRVLTNEIRDYMLVTKNTLDRIIRSININSDGHFLFLCPNYLENDEFMCLVQVQKTFQEFQFKNIPQRPNCDQHRREVSPCDFEVAKDSENSFMKMLEAPREENAAALIVPALQDLKVLAEVVARKANLPIPREFTRTKCPVTMQQNWRRYQATVTNGDGDVIQGEESDVSLTIPPGEQGVYLTRVHTDLSRFKGVIPKDECLIAPPVEVEHLQNGVNAEKTLGHVVKIPHCVRNRSSWEHFRVRRGDIYKARKFEILKMEDEASSDTDYYTVDDSFITIVTRSFSQFICTSCESSCNATVIVFVVGHLRKVPNRNLTTVKAKIFLCSDLYRIKDFKNELLRMQEEYKLKKVAEQGIDIKNERFDPGRSRVTLKIFPAEYEADQWGPTKKHDLHWQQDQGHFLKATRLSSVMHLEGCHLCRSPYPRDALTVDLLCRERRDGFDGGLEAVIHAACTPAGAALPCVSPGQGSGESPGVSYRPVTYEDFSTQADFTVECIEQAIQIQESIPVEKKLTDSKLLKLSKHLAKAEDLYTLAVIGLGISDFVVEKHLQEKYNSILLASYGVFKQWRSGQPSQEVAYDNMCSALKNSKDFKILIKLVLET